MRQWAATVAGGLLDMVPQLEATANGVVIDVFYKGKPLEPALDVAEACSGMRLLMAFLALGVAMAICTTGRCGSELSCWPARFR